MRILIADDELISRRMLAAALGQMGHEVVATSDGQAAWDVLQREEFSLVVADWMMAGTDGLELVRRIRACEFDHYVYFILLTSRAEKQDVVMGLEAGADDYIIKPFDRAELTVRVNCGRRIIDLERELAEKSRQMAQMARMDGLTNIGNRRFFDETLDQFHDHARRYGHAYSMAMIDIDFFKSYNDQFGHAAGDTVLRTVAQLLKASGRPSDLLFRYGGEEFVCLFPETDADGARAAATRLHRAVADARIPHPGNQPARVVTISVGLSTSSVNSPASATEVLRAADEALFEAKRGGRNRVVAAPMTAAGGPGTDDPPESGTLPEVGGHGRD
ncbi:MAG: diguanylate cyclase [Acidobacteria bacterium]|nr:diguanylate cyclase [Acidobacteriota bacterium]